MKIVFINVPGLYQKQIENTIESFFEKRKINPQSIININFVSKLRLRALNKKYRKIDQDAFVLSFPIWENLEELPKTGAILLGDIFISRDHLKDKKDLKELINHSLDHLVGKHH